jgi:hypothetical protein
MLDMEEFMIKNREEVENNYFRKRLISSISNLNNDKEKRLKEILY